MSGAPTNQVIPREVVAQWEREADASMPSKGKGCNPTSWRAYCTAAYSTDVEPKLPRLAAIYGAFFGGVSCLAVALLHLPFCCCAPDGPAPNGPTHDGCRSCSLAFTQTVCCGWCCSYLLTLCSQIDGEQSYHDWLHGPFTEEELLPHREAFVAKKTAMCASPERMAELERSLADAQGEKATAKVEELSTLLAAARDMAATIEPAAEKELHAALQLAKADHGASIELPRLGLAITMARQHGVRADLIEQAESAASEFTSRELADQPGTFCFLSAEALRSGRFEKMPVYADALLVPGLISRHTLNLRTACLKKYTSKYLAISHRWP